MDWRRCARPPHLLRQEGALPRRAAADRPRVIPHMRSAISLLVISTLLGGCSPGERGIRRGTPITHVQSDFGEPDVISDSSGDLTRFYVPTNRPREEWPWEAPRTFYYLDRNLAVTFERGKAVRAEAIDAETRERMLEPLVRRHGGAG